MNKKKLTAWLVLGTLAALVEGLILQSLHAASPSLLVPVLLYIASKNTNASLILALWLGFLLDVIAVAPFGVFMFISVGMLTLAQSLNDRGIEFIYLPTLLLASAILLGWQYAVLAVVGVLSGSYSIEMFGYLGFIYGLQVLLTTVLGFVLLRLVRV